VSRGEGAWFWDVDGNRYLDYLGAWGPLILGHRHPHVVEALRDALADGWVFGASSEWELAMARAVSEAFPSMEMVRFVNSGAEAVQAAVRLARAATGRDRLVKLEGGYHGHVESLDSADEPDPRAGVPSCLVDLTTVVPFGDLEAMERAVRSGDVAAMVVEPVPGSMGVIIPDDAYLRGLREIADRHAVLLLFDEVLTGFRVARGGAQERWGVRADITALGKIVGGGMPCGAYGASRAIMEKVAPLGPMYQAGTFSGNPMSMRAGLATLEVLARPGVYEGLERVTRRLSDGLSALGLQVPSVGGMFGVMFAEGPVRCLADFRRCDEERFARFFFGMLERGYYFPPSQSDAAAVSMVHTEAEVDRTLAAAADVIRAL
jgi:glutamate-1-semialdehyde 2,1-aminomutase